MEFLRKKELKVIKNIKEWNKNQTMPSKAIAALNKMRTNWYTHLKYLFTFVNLIAKSCSVFGGDMALKPSYDVIALSLEGMRNLKGKLRKLEMEL